MSDDWWVERQQNKRLQGLEEDLSYVSASLSSARASQNRLKAELSKVSGSLEQRLNRLTAAFDAFVEISDLRVTLGLFDDHGRVRHQAKQLLAGGQVGEVSDVDGYWLPPALVAVRGAGDGVVDEEALALAAARDPLRAAVWHVLIASVLGGRKTVPDPTLEVALPSLTDALPAYQRTIWLLAADGLFGEPGAELARLRAVEYLRGLSDEDRSAALSALRNVAVPKAAVSMPAELDGGGDLMTVLQACERLTVLRTWVTEAVGGYTGEPATEVDPAARQTVELLVNEGSPVELPLLARERELRAVIEGTATASTTWDSPGEPAVELLRTAATAEDHPNRRALAARSHAALLLDMAEGFAKTAQGTAPDKLSVRTRYGQVAITPTGPDPASLEKALGVADRAAQVESRRRQVAYGAVAVGVLFIVLAVTAGWGWVFVALGALGTGLYQWLTDAKERRDAAAAAIRAKENLRADVTRRVEAFAATRTEIAQRQSTVGADLTAIREALA